MVSRQLILGLAYKHSVKA